MNNTTRIRKEKQAWQEISFTPVQSIVKDPVATLTELPEKYKALINYILEAENKKYRQIYPTQTTLGKAMGCGRQRANEIVGECQSLGLIDTNYRHMKSCLYRSTSFLRSPFMAQKLGHIFPALQKLVLLLAIGSFKGEATQGNLKNYNVYGSRENFKKNGMNFGEIYQKSNPQVNRNSPLPQCLVRQPLTIKQKCELAAFPEWLIDQAMFKITDMSLIKNLGGYLYKYCSDRWKSPDWIWSSKLKDIYKNELDYEKLPLFAEEEDEKEVYHTTTFKNDKQLKFVGNKSGGKFPQKERQEYQSPEPRRSHEGISPMVHTERPPERLLSLSELRIQMDKYNAMTDKTLASLFCTGLMNRQAKLINELTPEQLSFWNSDNR